MRKAIPIMALVALAGCGGGHRRHHIRVVGVKHYPVQSATPSVFPPSPGPRVPTERHQDRPNIVFVLTDDLSDDLVPYLPSVQKLEQEGTSFSRYVVSDSLCCPSRASIFTGRLPHDTGVFTNIPPDGGLYAYTHHHDGRHVFAQVLKDRGYRTAMFGKYLNGYRADSGFVPRGWTDWSATARGYEEFNYNLDEDGVPTHYGNKPDDYMTDVLAARSSRFIDASALEGRPFFLETATFAPHRPAIPAPRYRDIDPDAAAPRTVAYNRQQINPPRWLRHRPPFSPGTIARIDHDFRERVRCIAAVNDLILTLEQHLRAAGQLRDTYFIFSSDNGYHLGQHRLLPGKLTAFDTDVKVPLIVVGPHVPAGRTVGALTQNTDLAPTFEQLAGATPNPSIDGRSLVRLLHGRRVPRDWRRAALVEHHHPVKSKHDPDHQTGESGDPPTYEALRTKHSTYVEYMNGDREFYDDRIDPEQVINIYRSLPPRRQARLHAEITALEHCHGVECATRGDS